ncbi:MAG: hypothetical protein ACYSTG_05660 [Planctomycetota bacterium]|jgi:hypothetical protein
MSRARQALVLFAVLTNSAPAPAAEGYLCLAEHSAGIAFDKVSKRWAATIFKPDQKVLVSKANDEEKKKGAVWVVKSVGSNREAPDFVCKEDFDNNGYLHCSGFGDFMFNRRNLRFLSTFTFGYVTDGLGETNWFGEEGTNTPALSAGKCSPL